jgi:hypothetical protein
MNARQFFDNVALMRMYQRNYSKHRRKSDLLQSKRYESMIDDEIDRVNAIIGVNNALKPPPTLFTRDDK